MERGEALRAIEAEVARGQFAFPTSTAVMLRIREAVEDPDCHVDKAAKLIQAEPLLAARIVALANSVALNPSGREINDVRTAVARVGFTTVRSLVMAAVTRQMAGDAGLPAQHAAREQLWSHSAHVAALARVIARRVTHQNPDAAMFAGLVHEIGGFYLISRAAQYPALLEPAPVADGAAGGEALDYAVERDLCLAVLKKLAVPAATIADIEAFWQGFLEMPPASMSDTLLLADHLAPVASPMVLPADSDTLAKAGAASLEILIGDETLSEILSESAAEVDSLTRALQF